MQLLAAGNRKPIFVLLHLRSHGLQVGGNSANPVRFFYPKFPGIADADAFFGEGCDGGQYGNFVDQRGRVRSADFGRFQLVPLDLYGTDQFPMLLFQVRDRNMHAQPHQDIEQSGSSGIH